MVPLLWFLGGCFPYKKLKEGETLLVKNKITLESAGKIKNKKGLTNGLRNSYQQMPSTRTIRLGLRNRFYYYTNEPGDTSKFKNFIRKSLVDVPAIYDQQLTDKTVESMTFYLQNKGYKDAVVRDTFFTKKKKTTVEYIVEPHQQYVVDSIYFASKDSAIQLILNDLKSTSILKIGSPVTDELFNAEAKRITTTLQNQGYAYFEQNFIKPRGLTKGNKVIVYYDLLVPPETGFHQKYTIGNIFIDPYYVRAGSLLRERDTILAQGVHFIFDSNTTRKIKPANILRSLFIRPGQVYQEDNFLKSNRQLRSLDIIKDVNIVPKIDPDNPDVLNFEIFLYPNKRMAIGGDLELNNSTYSAANTNLIGVSASINYRNRNLFKNAASFTTRAQLGFEFDLAAGSENLLYSRDISILNDLYFPRFVDPTRISKILRNTKLMSNRFYTELRDRTKTRVSLNYENISLFNFYGYNSFSTTFGYDLQRNANNRFQVNQIGVNLALVDKKQGFLDIEAANPFLQRSFDDQLFTGFLFRDFTYIHTGKINKRNTSFYFRGNLELSGGEVFLVNKIHNSISGNNKTFSFLNDVDYAQYARVETDFRWYKTFNKRQSFATRISSGIAFNYGFSAEVPYVKQFFIGGPNSLRAWRIRELGPGSFYDPAPVTSSAVPFYQAGDVILELSAEYRFDLLRIFGYTIESAFYLDAGNIWTLNEDTSRPGSQLNSDFLKEIAIGGGSGIRLDFSYFILRFDAAVKLRNPFPDENDKYWIDRNWRKIQWKDFNYNLAVGYPF